MAGGIDAPLPSLPPSSRACEQRTDLGFSPPHEEQKVNRSGVLFFCLFSSFPFFPKTLFHCSTLSSHKPFKPHMAALSRLVSLQAHLLAFLDKYPKTLQELKQPRSLVRVLATLAILNALRKVKSVCLNENFMPRNASDLWRIATKFWNRLLPLATFIHSAISQQDSCPPHISSPRWESCQAEGALSHS